MRRMITMHVRPRQTDERTNIMAIARRFVLANASRAKKEKQRRRATYVVVIGVGRHPSLNELFDVASRWVGVGLCALDAADYRHDWLAVRSRPVDVDHSCRSVQCFTVGVETGQVDQEVGVVPFLHTAVHHTAFDKWQLRVSSALGTERYINVTSALSK